uniref:PH domain-containing protein n=1 Tax=Candidatus Kentrum sp. MB TaxID=2138164 RepID=A0A450X6E1_9GAMM|nr:MAG: PH domain-containing protein [Candidatus Kentron sp. MB]VFK30035.1 MAG: PH domain-containing protein [Candidatus Kentron sp. MB]VFK75026.1 MAG: PH domain-containing protein [Candidatus Kentron sp. MB]
MVNQLNEKIMWQGKPSRFFWYKTYFLAFIILLAGILLLFSDNVLSDIWLSLGIHQYIEFSRNLYIGEGLIALSLFIYLFVDMSRIAKGKYTVTNLRVSERRGLISNYTNEIRVKDIRAVNIRQNILQRLFGIGTLEIGSAASEPQDVHFINIRNPRKINELIHNLQHD